MKFVIYGEPKGKGRPRFRNAGKFITTYTPKETDVKSSATKTPLYQLKKRLVAEIYGVEIKEV